MKSRQLALDGFLAGPLFWNLEMLVLMEGGKLEDPVKNLRHNAKTNNKLNPH